MADKKNTSNKGNKFTWEAGQIEWIKRPKKASEKKDTKKKK